MIGPASPGEPTLCHEHGLGTNRGDAIVETDSPREGM